MIKTLKGKMSLIYLCLVVITAFVGYVSVINLYNLTQTIDGLMTNNYKSIQALNNMLEAIDGQDRAILTYINGSQNTALSIYKESTESFSKWYGIEYNNVTEKDEKAKVDKLNMLYNTYRTSFTNLQGISKTDGEDAAVSYYTSKILPILSDIKLEIKSLSFLNEKAMLDSKNKAFKGSQKSMNFILTLSSLAVIIGCALSLLLTNKFISPIHSLTRAVKSVKAGDLTQHIHIKTNDEIGELAQEFNNMTKQLRKYEQSNLGKLMTEKNKSLTIVKGISEPLMVLDKNFRFTLVNHACESLFKIWEAKILGKHFQEVLPHTELFTHIESVFQSNLDYSDKIIMIKQGEEILYYNVLVTKTKDINEHIKDFIIILQNVTQFKQLERIKTDFIATVSHEFKTPLTSIMMGTSLILDENLGTLNNKQRDIVEAINEDGERLTNLVTDLLELTRIESGKSIFKMEPCSIIGIIENSIKPLYRQAQQKDIKLYFEVEEKHPKVKADAGRITWVLNNLITNALKYTNAGDEILVKALVKQDTMVVSVRDTGVGIPQEYQEKIFDKFVQVKGYDLEVRGTGLGLSIVKEIIETHGGKIWCESKIDEGSCFTFTLPLNV